MRGETGEDRAIRYPFASPMREMGAVRIRQGADLQAHPPLAGAVKTRRGTDAAG